MGMIIMLIYGVSERGLDLHDLSHFALRIITIFHYFILFRESPLVTFHKIKKIHELIKTRCIVLYS